MVFESTMNNGSAITEDEKANLEVYPNPNDGNFTLDYELDDNIQANLYLITVSGEKVLLSKNVSLKGRESFNISGSFGVYQVTLEDVNGRILKSSKIVITH